MIENNLSPQDRPDPSGSKRLKGGLYYIIGVPNMDSAHRHHDVELNLVMSGTASYVLHGRRYELRRNTLVWLFPDQTHLLLDKSRGFDYWLGLFPMSLLRRYCADNSAAILLESDPQGYFCRSLNDAAAARLAAIFDGATQWSNKSTSEAGLGFSLLAAWEEFCGSSEHVGQNIHPAIDHAMTIICQEVDPIGLELIAEKVGLSPQYLSELFKAQTGMTLSHFRNKRRIERFLQQNTGESGRTSILERALDAGFGSYPQFHRVFKEQVGCTPSDYLKKSG